MDRGCAVDALFNHERPGFDSLSLHFARPETRTPKQRASAHFTRPIKG